MAPVVVKPKRTKVEVARAVAPYLAAIVAKYPPRTAKAKAS